MVQGSTECLKGPFDLVVANLPWEVQMDKVTELDRLAASKGRLILSGFRDNQENLLIESYQRLGWSLDRRLVRDFQHPELPPDISFTWVAWLLGKKTVLTAKPQNVLGSVRRHGQGELNRPSQFPDQKTSPESKFAVGQAPATLRTGPPA